MADKVNLSDDDVNRISSKVVTDMIQAQWVDPETHYEHHEWINRRLADEQSKKEFRERVLQSSIAWVLPIVIGFICLAVWHEIQDAFKNGGGG